MDAIELQGKGKVASQLPNRRRRKMLLAVAAETIESRLLLTIDPYMMYMMTQPPAVTGTVSIGVNYQYISPELVFNGVGDRTTPGIVRYDSAVPFIVSGQVSGQGRLRLTNPDGSSQLWDISGPFSVPYVMNTHFASGDSLLLKAEILPRNGDSVVATALKSEALSTQSFRFQDYLGRIGGQADSLVTSQVNSQLSTLLAPLLTDEAVTQMAMQRMQNDPLAFSLETTKTLIREEIATARGIIAQQTESRLRIGLQSAINGDQLDHRFVMGAGHPGAPEFAASMAASKAAANGDFTLSDVASMVSISGSMPSTSDLQSTLSNLHTADDILNLANAVPVTVGIQNPTFHIRDGVDFNASSSFQSTGVLTGNPEFSEYEVGAGIHFFRPLDAPPVLFGRKMRGSFNGFFRQSLNNGQPQHIQGGGADKLGGRLEIGF